MTKQEFIKDLTEKLKSDYDEQTLVLTKMLEIIRMPNWNRYGNITYAPFQELLKICTDVNKKPLLHEAIDHNRLEIVQMLIDAGADVNLKDEQGNTPLEVLNGNLEAAASSDDYYTRTYSIRDTTTKKMINLLLDAGAEFSEEMEIIKEILTKMYSGEIKKELEPKANSEVLRKLKEIDRMIKEEFEDM